MSTFIEILVLGLFYLGAVFVGCLLVGIALGVIIRTARRIGGIHG